MTVAHAAMNVIALDLGGTALKAGLVSGAGETLRALQQPSRRERGPDAVVAGLLEAVDELTDGSVAAVGLVVPGVVDNAAGTAVFSANFGWRDLPLRALLSDHTGLPVAFGHDVRAGGLAEGALGAARGAGDFLFLALGTGVAGAAVLDGRPYAGGGYAGEIGHVVVEPGGRACGCGARGCLETVASAHAIAARYAEAAQAAGEPRPAAASRAAASTGAPRPAAASRAPAPTGARRPAAASRAAASTGARRPAAASRAAAPTGAPRPAAASRAAAPRPAAASRAAAPRLTAADVAARCAAGDALACRVWSEAIDALSAALATYVSVLAPELIVIGGGLSAAGDQLLAPLDAALAARLTFHRRPRLVRAALGDQAGRLGAALMAAELVGVAA